VSTPKGIEKIAEADFPTRWGKFRILGFEGNVGPIGERRKEAAVAVVMGDVYPTVTGAKTMAKNIAPAKEIKPPLVRLHSQCFTGDVFGSLRCDCRQQLEMALAMISAEGRGILIYEQQEGRGIGLMAKLQAYALQDRGLDTVEANVRLGFKPDQRDYAMPVAVLKALGVSRIRFLSNNPDKIAAMENAGIQVVERVPCEVQSQPVAERYLKTKKEKMGHLFTSR
jgi:GTP cyclohydrolase II